LGRISGLFGVQGWVKVFSYTRPREAILEYDRWYLKRQGEWQAAAVREAKRHGKTVIAHLDGVDDRDAAATLVDCDIAVEREAMPDADDGSYYWADLEGLQVVRRDGTGLGRVAYLMETGANDVLVVQGEQERLIPFVAAEVILDVDLDNGVIRVDWDWD
jgi:16S rRNA processing protein RimM